MFMQKNDMPKGLVKLRKNVSKSQEKIFLFPLKKLKSSINKLFSKETEAKPKNKIELTTIDTPKTRRCQNKYFSSEIKKENCISAYKEIKEKNSIFPLISAGHLKCQSQRDLKIKKIIKSNEYFLNKGYIQVNPKINNILISKKNFEKMLNNLKNDEVKKSTKYDSLFFINNKKLYNKNTNNVNSLIESKIKYKIIDNIKIKFDNENDKIKYKNLFKNFGDVTYFSYLNKQ